MKTQEINRNQWEEFMNEFSRQHDGWVATVEVQNSGAQGHRIVAQNEPFLGMSAEVGVGGSGRDYVNITVGRDESGIITHRIISPQRIAFRETDSGAHEGVEVESRDEGKTIVRFSSPARPETLNGLPEIGVR